MGRFSTNINVKCADFADKFTEIMKKRGYETCTEDYATLSYVIAQGQFWATLAEKNYNSDIRMTLDDTKFIAKELNTPAFMLEVVDSDFAMIKLNGTEVIVGNGSGYGIENAPKPDRTLWEPLVTDGTFERLTEIWQTHEVFVEDALAKSAPLLGIEPQFIMADYREILDMSDGANITRLYFKKIGAGKPLTLNAAFKQVFGEGLEPLGYKRIKSKYPYFVRVVPGGEIIHVISCEESLCSYPRSRRFDIVGGIATVYRYKIELDKSTKNNNTWLNTIGTFYARTADKSEFDQRTMMSFDEYGYNESDNLSLLNAMSKAFENAKKYMLSYLDRAVDLKSSLNCIKVLRQKCSTNNFHYPLHFDGCDYHDEGFLYIKTSDGTSWGDSETQRFVTDTEVLAEVERRKTFNTETLRSYGLDI